MLIAINLHIATRQILKEEINGGRAIVLGAFLGIAATLDDIEELSEFDHLGPVFVDGLDDLLNLLPVVDEAECDQRVLQFVHANAAGSVVVERVEVVPQLLQLIIFEVDAVLFAARLEPLVELAWWVEEQLLLSDNAILVRALFIVIVFVKLDTKIVLLTVHLIRSLAHRPICLYKIVDPLSSGTADLRTFSCIDLQATHLLFQLILALLRHLRLILLTAALHIDVVHFF